MIYFGIEIYDGKIYSEFPLEEHKALYEQKYFLTNDIGAVVYDFGNGVDFFIDISWFGDWYNINDGLFTIKVCGGEVFDGKTFYYKELKTLMALKESLQYSVNLIQRFKLLSILELENFEVEVPLKTLYNF